LWVSINGIIILCAPEAGVYGLDRDLTNKKNKKNRIKPGCNKEDVSMAFFLLPLTRETPKTYRKKSRKKMQNRDLGWLRSRRGSS
jgi:hypothetical protein